MQDWSWFNASDLTKGQQTKLRIMNGALTLFSKNGFNQVTLKEIAKETKTSHPLILKHFGSKEELLFAVRKLVTFSNYHWVDSKVKETMSGLEALHLHCYENINWGFHNPEKAKIILLTYYYSSLDGLNIEMGSGAMKAGIARMHKYILQSQREGLISADIKSQWLAEMIHEYCVGLFIKMLATEDTSKDRLPRRYKSQLVHVIDALIKS